MPSSTFSTTSSKPDFSERFQNYRLNGTLTDVTILVGDKKYSAHRIILENASPKFAELLTESAAYELDENFINGETLETILDFIYTGKITLIDENIHSLTIAASYLEISNLFVACEQFLVETFSLTVISDILLFAITTRLANLQQSCTVFFNEHLEEIFGNCQFFNHNVGNLKLNLSQVDKKKLNFDVKRVLFSSLIAWVERNFVDRLHSLAIQAKLIGVHELLRGFILEISEKTGDSEVNLPSCSDILKELKEKNPEKYSSLDSFPLCFKPQQNSDLESSLDPENPTVPKSSEFVVSDDTLPDRLQQYRREGKFIDMTIFVGHGKFPAHRIVLNELITRGNLLKIKKKKKNNESTNIPEYRFNLEFVNVAIMEDLLTYLYTKEIAITDKNKANLLSIAANYLKLTELAEKCEQFLAVKRSLENRNLNGEKNILNGDSKRDSKEESEKNSKEHFKEDSEENLKKGSDNDSRKSSKTSSPEILLLPTDLEAHFFPSPRDNGHSPIVSLPASSSSPLSSSSSSSRPFSFSFTNLNSPIFTTQSSSMSAAVSTKVPNSVRKAVPVSVPSPVSTAVPVSVPNPVPTTDSVSAPSPVPTTVPSTFSLAKFNFFGPELSASTNGLNDENPSPNPIPGFGSQGNGLNTGKSSISSSPKPVSSFELQPNNNSFGSSGSSTNLNFQPTVHSAKNSLKSNRPYKSTTNLFENGSAPKPSKESIDSLITTFNSYNSNFTTTGPVSRNVQIPVRPTYSQVVSGSPVSSFRVDDVVDFSRYPMPSRNPVSWPSFSQSEVKTPKNPPASPAPVNVSIPSKPEVVTPEPFIFKIPVLDSARLEPEVTTQNDLPFPETESVLSGPEVIVSDDAPFSPSAESEPEVNSSNGLPVPEQESVQSEPDMIVPDDATASPVLSPDSAFSKPEMAIFDDLSIFKPHLDIPEPEVIASDESTLSPAFSQTSSPSSPPPEAPPTPPASPEPFQASNTSGLPTEPLNEPEVSHLYCFGNINGNLSPMVACRNESTGRWSNLTGMIIDKSFYTGASTGSKIYLCGGWKHRRTFDTMEEYDCTTHTWNQLLSMPEPRSNCSAAIIDDFIYISGGQDYYNNPLSSVIRYSIENDKYEPISGMNRKRYCHRLVALNGHLYAINGYQANKTVEKYDPETDIWSMVSSTNYNHHWFGATVHDDGKIYILSREGFEFYSPADNCWRVLEPLTDYDGQVLVSVNGRLLAVSSKEEEKTFPVVYWFEMTSGQWQKLNGVDAV